MKYLYAKKIFLFLWAVILVIGCSENTEDQVKVLKENYPDGSLKLQRTVRQDSSGNLFNHGKYVSWYENGKKEIEALYKDGKKHGKFIWWSSSGKKKMEGSYENGLNTGQWTFYHLNGKRAEQGEFYEGKRHGIWTEFDYDGQKTGEGEYLNGKRHGKWTFWREPIEPAPPDPSNIQIVVEDIPEDEPESKAVPDTTLPWYNNAIRAECEFKEGLKNGIGISWYANGQKAAQCTYKDNVKHGKLILWDEKNEIQEEFQYVNGILNGKYVRYQNGKKAEEYEYKHGQIDGDGQYVRWTEEGQIEYDGKFRNFTTSNAISGTPLFVPYDEPPTPVDGIASIQRNLIYPEIARKAGIEGKVILNVLISETGEVLETRIMKSFGHALDSEMNEAAVNAIKSVKWKPALQDNNPVRVWVAIPVTFRLR